LAVAEVSGIAKAATTRKIPRANSCTREQVRENHDSDARPSERGQPRDHAKYAEAD
jgi:hypothetical protein